MKTSLALASVLVTLALAAAAWLVHARFAADIAAAAGRAAHGSRVVATRCGAIEVQEAGSGAPLLMVHGSGGGHDQGMDFARPFAAQGFA